jgi:hypothetical protein
MRRSIDGVFYLYFFLFSSRFRVLKAGQVCLFFFSERERERKEGKGEREKKGAVKKEAFPERRERYKSKEEGYKNPPFRDRKKF